MSNGNTCYLCAGPFGLVWARRRVPVCRCDGKTISEKPNWKIRFRLDARVHAHCLKNKKKEKEKKKETPVFVTRYYRFGRKCRYVQQPSECCSHTPLTLFTGTISTARVRIFSKDNDNGYNNNKTIIRRTASELCRNGVIVQGRWRKKRNLKKKTDILRPSRAGSCQRISFVHLCRSVRQR